MLEWVKTPPRPLGPDEVRLDVLAAPAKRADVEIRSGTWRIRTDDPWPYTPGLEFVGTVTETGTDVDDVATDDRAITMRQKMAGIHGIRPDIYQESIVVQLVDALGGTAIATTRRAQAADLRELGADAVVNLSESSLVEALGRNSVEAVFETVGQATFAASTAVLARHGRLCCVGAASGAELSLSAWDLLQDLHLTGYSTENLTANQLRADVDVLAEALQSGEVEPPPFE